MKLIATVDENWGLGYKGKPLFDIRENRKRYLYHIGQNPVIMGRKTFKLIGPLSGRFNIILSESGINNYPLTIEEMKNNKTEYLYYSSINDILKIIKFLGLQDKVIVIGGAKTFEAFIDYCDGIYITKVEKKCKDVDVYFPVNLDEEKEQYSLIYSSLTQYSDGLFYTNYEYINTKVKDMKIL